MISRDSKLEHIISTYGLENGKDAIEASRRVGLPLSRACALLEMESGGRNIFGADPGGTALPRSWFDTPVTRFKYLVFKSRRKDGLTSNGVGPCQLTSPSFQDEADKLGGCWKPLYNMIVGFHTLVELGGASSEHDTVTLAYEHYNGSGPAAVEYGIRAHALAVRWHELFVSHGLA